VSGQAGDGRVAVITGAGTGIGRETARGLGEAGWRVVLAGRRREPLEEAASAIADARVQPTDVSDPESVRELFELAKEDTGRIDLLFNNAGITGPSVQLDEVKPEEWAEVMAINLNGSFYCAQEAFRAMRTQDPQGGRIINNGSVSAIVPRPHAVSYAAAKHAITGLTKSIALEGRQYNIACGQIDIGNAVSDMSTSFLAKALQPDGSFQSEALMATQDIARAIVYTASLPLEANVLSMTVMATQMPLVGRG
jgi:NAD(P)-dependent dehydrogenase (short-subunit alcohol dehydrogenase family)